MESQSPPILKHRKIGTRSRAPRWNTRAAVIVCGLVLYLLVFFALSGPSWPAALNALCKEAGILVLWLLGATGIGWIAWRLLKGRSVENDSPHPVLALVTCTALGLGTMSLAVLGLGLCGWLNRMTAAGLIVVGLCITFVLIAQRRRQWDAARWLTRPAGWHWLWALFMPLLAVTTIGALFPSGLLWGGEPQGYDVVEYHLQVPREWFEAGRIIPLHHNVFSFLPSNVEMHYLLAMHLRGGPWAGMFLAQLMHLAFCVLSIIAIFGLAGGGARGTIAAVLAGAVPWTMLLAALAYNEGGTLLFGILAIGWAMRAKSLRHFALAGIMAGLATGVKLPVAPLLLVAVPLALLIAKPRRERPDRAQAPGLIEAAAADIARVSPRDLLPPIAVYLLCALLVLSPWLIRNVAWARNPVFPEMMGILGRGSFSEVQAQRWRQAYLPDAAHRSVAGRLHALASEVLIDARFGFVIFPLGIAALVLGHRNRSLIYLLVLLLAQIVVWLTFTHLQSRFMVIAIPIIALMIAQHGGRDWKGLCAFAAIVLVGISGQILVSGLARYVAADRQIAKLSGFGLIGRENLDRLNLLDMSKLPPDAVIDLAGDAAAFRYQIPMSRLHYKTVFDVDTSDPAKNIIQDWIAGMPATPYVVLDSMELQRFTRTYYGMPSLEGLLPHGREPVSRPVPPTMPRVPAQSSPEPATHPSPGAMP